MADDDRFARFARAHLRLPAQRAVYAALAGAAGNALAGPEIAQRFHLDEHDVDIALRQFRAAGIVEEAVRVGADGGRMYRWKPTMAYLHEMGRGSGQFDPVCGMPIPANTACREDGHRFCSLRCQLAWRVATRSAR